ncbi:hypothetical protein B0H34DRAFT_85153 [Crassisporium funariophilum]|nr:hypothetical protein B0H34DRAFT_85153 [Crassisporium funariophilum]
MNQDSSPCTCYRLSCEVFVTICCSATPTKALFERLFGCDLYNLFTFHVQAAIIATTIPQLFFWFNKQAPLLKTYFPAENVWHNLYKHHLRSWEKAILDSVKRSPDQALARHFLTAIACNGSVQLHSTINSLILRNLTRLSSSSPHDNFFRSHLGLTPPMLQYTYEERRDSEEYYDMLSAFLTDPRRAGHHHVNGEDYHNLAEILFRHLLGLPDEHRDGRGLTGIQEELLCCAAYLPLLLPKATCSLQLVTCIRLLSKKTEHSEMLNEDMITVLGATEAFLSQQESTVTSSARSRYQTPN